MIDIILVVIIAAAFIGAVVHLIKAKKQGRACMGCPSSSTCGKKDCCEKE